MLTKEEQNMLLDDIKSGKTDAINKLARIALSVATQTLYRKFKIVDKVKVNDIVSKVVSKIDTFKPQYKLINWIIYISVHHQLNAWRDEPKFVYLDAGMLLGDAEEDAVNANLNECLTDSVKKLPENERNVINLHLEGKSFKAIGEELGICAQAAFKRYRKALKKLKNKLI